MKMLLEIDTELEVSNLENIVKDIYSIETSETTDAEVDIQAKLIDQLYWIKTESGTRYFMINIIEIKEDYTLFTIEELNKTVRLYGGLF